MLAAQSASTRSLDLGEEFSTRIEEQLVRDHVEKKTGVLQVVGNGKAKKDCHLKSFDAKPTFPLHFSKFGRLQKVV